MILLFSFKICIVFIKIFLTNRGKLKPTQIFNLRPVVFMNKELMNKYEKLEQNSFEILKLWKHPMIISKTPSNIDSELFFCILKDSFKMIFFSVSI